MSEDLQLLNLFRDRVVSIARDLDEGAQSAQEGARALFDAAEISADALQDPEIDIDFETGDGDGSNLGPFIAAVADKITRKTGNSLEDILTRIIHQRDRIGALRVAGEDVGERDVADYEQGLITLRDALIKTYPLKD